MFKGPFYDIILNFNLYVVLSISSLFIIFLFLNHKVIKKHFKNINKKIWVLLFVIIIFGGTLRVIFNHEPHWSNEPEWGHKINGKSFILYGKAHYIDQPHGHAFLLALTYSLLGANDLATLALNIFMSCLTILLVFLLTYILFKDTSTALFSSFILSIMPKHIYFSGTGENEITSIFFVLIFLLISIIAFKEDKLKIYILSAIAFSFACQIRIENIVFFFTFPLLYFLEKRKRDIKKLMISLVILIIFMVPLIPWYLGFIEVPYTLGNLIGKDILSTKWTNHFETQYGQYSLSENFSKYSYWLTTPKNHNPIYLVLVLLSFFFLKISEKSSLKANIKNNGGLVIIWFSFISYSLIYITYFTGSFSRYIVYFNPIIAIISAYSFIRIIKLIKRCVFRKFFVAFMVILLTLSTSYFSYKTNLFDPITDVKELIKFKKENGIATIYSCHEQMIHFEFGMADAKKLDISNRNIYVEQIRNNQLNCQLKNWLIQNYNLSLRENKKTIRIYDIKN